MQKVTSFTELEKIVDEIIHKQLIQMKKDFIKMFDSKAIMITFKEEKGVFPEDFIMKTIEELEADFLGIIDSTQIAENAVYPEVVNEFNADVFLSRYTK